MKKVLIVDDEADIVEVVSQYLKNSSSYQVQSAQSGEEAIKIMESEKFDLVITDMIMPNLNGIQLTEYIYQHYPQTKILACSGGGQSGSMVAGLALDQAIQQGANNGILKPFTEEQLLLKVKNLIGQ